MIYMPVQKLKESMVVGKDVNVNTSRNFGIPLIREKVALNDQLIDKLKRYKVPGIYIESEGTGDVCPQSVIEDKLKIKALTEIKNVFTAFGDIKKEITPKVIDGISNVAGGLVESVMKDREMLVNLVELKSHDDYTYTHSLCVSLLSVATGMALGYNSSRLRELSTASLLHDLGKIAIPISIINKPDKLTYEEFEVIKTHPARGRDLLEERFHMVSHSVLSAIKSHHEKYDGTGYPRGVDRQKIHPYARIISISDVFDALTSERPYRNAMQSSEAVEYLMAFSGTHFDPEILKFFLQKVAIYPVGSLVELSTGEIAIVVKNYGENVLRPLVRVIDENYKAKYDINLLQNPTCYNITIKKSL